METLIHRARQALMFMAPLDAMHHLCTQGVSREDAFLATKAAWILETPS